MFLKSIGGWCSHGTNNNVFALLFLRTHGSQQTTFTRSVALLSSTGKHPVFLQKQYPLWIFSSLTLDKISQGLAPLLNPRLTRPHSRAGVKLLKGNFTTCLFYFLLPCLRVFFLHVLLEHCGSTFYKVLCLFETESQNLLYHLDDGDFFGTYRSKFHIELTFLFDSRCARTRSRDSDCLRRNTKFLFEDLHELVQLEDGHLLNFLYQFLKLRWNFHRFVEGSSGIIRRSSRDRRRFSVLCFCRALYLLVYFF